MTAHLSMAPRLPMTVPRFRQLKGTPTKLTVLTAYDYLSARRLDAAGVDAVLVGDSLGMVFQGQRSTLPVTLREMIYHGRIVAKAVEKALVIVDMPFLTYHVSPQQAVRNAGRVLKETGAQAVKIETGLAQIDAVRAMVDAEIPVMAHVGLRPQSVHRLGGMNRVQRDRDTILTESRLAAEAGAFSIVLEMVPSALAAEITAAVPIPTIGIGAGADCDGQVLVTEDLLGLSGFTPKFVKPYADLDSVATKALEAYLADVRAGVMPGPEQTHQ